MTEAIHRLARVSCCARWASGRLRTLTAERDADVKLFLEYLAQEYPAAADRIQILLTATKGEDKELLKREFGGD